MERFLILLFTLLVQSCYGQLGTVWTTVDSVINNIGSELPNGWFLKSAYPVLRIEKIDSVWVMYVNHVNEPGKQLGYKEGKDEELKNIFQKEGRKEIYELSYKVEQRWSTIKLNQAKAHNDSLINSINKLWDKYEIETFYYHGKVTKGKQWDEDKFEPKTKDDSLKLAKYQAEKEQLKKLEITIPEKNTELYSLFPLGHTCYDRFYNNSMYTDVYPKSAKDEWFKVCEIISKHCDNKR